MLSNIQLRGQLLYKVVKRGRVKIISPNSPSPYRESTSVYEKWSKDVKLTQIQLFSIKFLFCYHCWFLFLTFILYFYISIFCLPVDGKIVRSWCDGSSDRSFMGWTHRAISRSYQCSTTGVTKAVVCVILSVGWCI